MAKLAPYVHGTEVFAAAAVVKATLAQIAFVLAVPPVALTAPVPMRRRSVSVEAVAMFVPTPQI